MLATASGARITSAIPDRPAVRFLGLAGDDKRCRLFLHRQARVPTALAAPAGIGISIRKRSVRLKRASSART